MTAVLKNLRSFLREHTVFFALMLVCICVSSGLMLFGYGLYQNYMLEKQNMEGASTNIWLFYEYRTNEENYAKTAITKGEFQDCIENIPQKVHDEMFGIYTKLHISKPMESDLRFGFVELRFNYVDGKFVGNPTAFNNYRASGGFEGRYFTEEEYANAERKLITSDRFYINNVPAQIGDTVRIDGEEFEIVARVGDYIGDEPIFPALPDSMYVMDTGITFNLPPTYAQYNSIKTQFEPFLESGAYTITEYEPFYDENYWLYNTIILVSVLIAVVAAFNIVVVYQYVLVKRQKSLAVFQICGCTKGKAIRMYVAESLIMIIFGFCAIALIYHFGLLPLLQNVFPFIATAYSFKLYAMAFAIYITICTIGTALLANMVVRKHSIVELKGGTAEC